MFAIDLLRFYGVKRTKGRCIFTRDEEGWITVHPHGEGTKGQPVKIEKRTGEILGGLGGKFNGQHISALPERGAHEEHGAQALIRWYNSTKKGGKGGKAGHSSVAHQNKGISIASAANKTAENWVKNHGNQKRDVKLYPDKFVGKCYTKEMTHKEADSGRVNPNYGKGKLYAINCQACVVAYEMRRRGYDVEALAKSDEFYNNFWDAFKNPVTGSKRSFTPIPNGRVGEAKKYAFLDMMAKAGNRYILYLKWKGNKGAHVVMLSRNKGNELEIYDPQIDKMRTGQAEITNYLTKTSKSHWSVAVVRSDDVEFDQVHAKNAFA